MTLLLAGLARLALDTPALVFAAALLPAVAAAALVVRLDRRAHARRLLWLAAFLWGAVVAPALAVAGNEAILAWLGDATDAARATRLTGALAAPAVEELAKGAALVLLVACWRREVRGVRDGIVFGALVGVGFTMAENLYYFALAAVARRRRPGRERLPAGRAGRAAPSHLPRRHRGRAGLGPPRRAGRRRAGVRAGGGDRAARGLERVRGLVARRRQLRPGRARVRARRAAPLLVADRPGDRPLLRRPGPGGPDAGGSRRRGAAAGARPAPGRRLRICGVRAQAEDLRLRGVAGSRRQGHAACARRRGMPDAERLDPLDLASGENLLLARRLRVSIALSLAPLLAYAVFDLALLPRDRLPLYWALKLGALLVIAWSIAMLRRRPGRPHSRARLVGVGLGSVAALYAFSTVSAVLAEDGQTTAILTLAVTLATATLLPWGIGPQLVVVAIGAASTMVAYYGAHGSLYGLLQYPTMGLLIGMGTSVFVAGELERSRRALAARPEQQHRVEQQVRQLNERLEARVAERTAQLEAVNAALQAEVEERTRFAAELRHSQAAASALIENADDAIWAIDRGGRLLLSNAALRRRYADALGRELDAAQDYPQQAREQLATYWAPLYARALAGERFRDEQIVDGAAGRRIFENAFNPIVIDGVVAGVAVFSSETTELRRSEEAARQRQAELTHVQRLSTLGELAAGLAHEINQPLAAIVNYARGSARRLRGNPASAAEVLPAIDSISAEALRAGEVIRRLRQLVRKEAPRREPVDLNALAADALRIVGPEARQAGVLIEAYPAADLPRVVGDGIQIEQVVLNLLRNAIEAMASGDERRVLQLSTRLTDAGGVEVAVRDTGPGMAPGVADLAFEPFVSTKPSGLGMGLSISRTIAEAHGGRLWGVANPDGGMTFRLVLPLAQAAGGRALPDPLGLESEPPWRTGAAGPSR
ncbi:MAG: PrsW family glutamic-type intramembrane protease [Candidatus Binatia bacterium]